MRKILTITFTMLILLISTSVYAATDTWLDDGNYDTTWLENCQTNDEYVINDEAELAAFAYATNKAGEDFEDKTIVLNANLDISGKEWISIKNFKGNFDGKGFEISGLTITQDNGGKYFGFFETIPLGGDVRNLDLVDVSINISNPSSNSIFVGMLYGYQGNISSTATGITKIYNVNAEGSINIETSHASRHTTVYVGGLIGYSQTPQLEIANCNVTIKEGNKIKAVSSGGDAASYSSKMYVGGIIGYLSNTSESNIVATDLILNGEIYVDGGTESDAGNIETYVGGIGGYISTCGQIASCRVAGNGSIIAKSNEATTEATLGNYNSSVGGLIGETNTIRGALYIRNSGVQIEKISTVTNDGKALIGGVVGYADVNSTLYYSGANYFECLYVIINNSDASTGLDYTLAGAYDATLRWNNITGSIYSNLSLVLADPDVSGTSGGVALSNSYKVSIDNELKTSSGTYLVELLNNYVNNNEETIDYLLNWRTVEGILETDTLIATPEIEDFEYSNDVITREVNSQISSSIIWGPGEIGEITYQWEFQNYTDNSGEYTAIAGANGTSYTTPYAHEIANKEKEVRYRFSVANTYSGETISVNKETDLLTSNPRIVLNMTFPDGTFSTSFLYTGNQIIPYNCTKEELIAKAIFTDESSSGVTVENRECVIKYKKYSYSSGWVAQSTPFSYVHDNSYSYKIEIRIYNDEYEATVEQSYKINKVKVYVEQGTYAMTKEYDGTTDEGTTSGEYIIKLQEGATASLPTVILRSTTYEDANIGDNKNIILWFDLDPSEARSYRNYVFDPTSEKYTFASGKITPKTVTATISGDLEKVYDGTTNAPEGITIELSGLASGETAVSATATFAYDDANVGTDKTITATNITLSGDNAGNYILASNEASVSTASITKADYTGTTTYEAQALANRATENFEIDLSSILPTGYELSNATYKTNTDNIFDTTNKTTPEINAATIKVDIVSVEIGKTGVIELTVNSTNYNEYTLTITVNAVDKETITISGLTIANKEYDGTPINYTGTISVSETNVAVDSLVWLYTGSGDTTYSSGDAPTNAGSYKLTISVPNTNERYTGSVVYPFEITKKALVVNYDTTSTKTKVYDGTTKGPEDTRLILSGLIDTTDVVSVTATFTYDNANVGTEKILTASNIVLIGEDKGNYTVNEETLNIANASITPKVVTLKSATAENRSYKVGDKTVNVTAIEFNETSPLPEATTYTLTGTMADENAGENKEVTVTVTLTDTNYSLTVNTITTTVNIAKISYNKDITGAASVRGNVAKSGVTYNLEGLLNLPTGYTFGTPTYTENTDGVLTGTPSITDNVLTFDIASKAVGKTGKIQIPVSSTNYTDVNAVLTITTIDKEPLTIDGLNYASKEYDGTVVTPTGTLTVTDNKVAIENLNVEWLYFNVEQNEWHNLDQLVPDAGKYRVYYSIPYVNENYTGERTYEFEITKKTPTITINNLTQYVGSVTNVTYKITPAVTSGETKIEYKLSASGDADYKETMPTEIGTYTVKVSVSGDTNLNDTEKTETLIIKTKPVSTGGGGGSATTKYEIKVTQNEGGVISPETTKVEKGDNQTFEIKANEGYKIEDVLVDNVSVGKVSSYTFENVKAKHTIEAKFTEAIIYAEAEPFEDVENDDWYYEAVKYVYTEKLFNGVSDTEFAPEEPTTRGMIVTVLWRMENKPVVNYLMTFDDVEENEYYTEAIRWAASEKIVNGYSEEIYDPNGLITREQLATILYRYTKYKKADVSVGENTNILSYDDFDQISEYAIPAIQWACGAGIIKGRTQSTLAPQGTATRSEVATMMMRYNQ